MNSLNYINNLIAEKFLEQRSDLGLDFFLAISFLGDWRLLLPLSLLIVFFLFFKKKKRFILPFLFVFLGSGAVALLAKDFFALDRPASAAIEEGGASFPSGHAVLSLSFYSSLLCILFKILKGRYFYFLLSLNIFLVILIGFSRLYIGVHYLGDVLAGYLLSLLFLILGIFIYNKTKNYFYE
jgi:membrane-associated phospholipid phosphatase